MDGAPSSEHGSQNALTGADPGASTSIEVRPESALHTDKGTTTIAEGVVAKIVGMAAREVAAERWGRSKTCCPAARPA